jgi:hypothetical protein
VILLTSIAAGILTGWACARWQGRSWRPPLFQATWLVALGFLPQMFAFYLPLTRRLFPDWLASGSLVLSQITLLAFALLNWRLFGMPLLIFGLGCNLLVILVNGGFMPLPVETASRLVSASVLDSLEVGGRISSTSKDILLRESRILLPFLSDRFIPPTFFPYRFAFSLGDIFIGFGAFGLLLRGQPAVKQPN